jgi:hypothetical protein
MNVAIQKISKRSVIRSFKIMTLRLFCIMQHALQHVIMLVHIGKRNKLGLKQNLKKYYSFLKELFQTNQSSR